MSAAVENFDFVSSLEISRSGFLGQQPKLVTTFTYENSFWTLI